LRSINDDEIQTSSDVNGSRGCLKLGVAPGMVVAMSEIAEFFGFQMTSTWDICELKIDIGRSICLLLA
jgi:hypothetical protein